MKRVDYEKLHAAERAVGIEPTPIPAKTKAKQKRREARQKWWDLHLIDVVGSSVIGIGVIFALWVIAFKPFSSPVHSRPLPAHVYPWGNRFIVDSGYGYLRRVLCEEENASVETIHGGYELVACEYGPNRFYYNRSQVWKGAE